MSPTLRRWAMVVTLAVAFGVATSSQAQADATKYFPKDAEVVININFRQMMDSKLVKGNKETVAQMKKQMEDFMQKDEALGKLFKTLGFDVFTDLNSVTAVMGTDFEKKNGLFIIEGKFDPAKVKTAGAKAVRDYAEVLKMVKMGDRDVYQITPPGKEDQMFMTLVNKSTMILAANKDSLEQALAQEGGKKVELSPQIRTLLKSTSAKQSMSLLATSKGLDAIIKQGNNPQAQMAGAFLEKIEGLSMSFTLGSEIQFQLGVGAKNADAADELSKQAQQALGFVNLMVAQQANQNPQMAPLVDIAKTLRASSQGPNVMIRGQVSAATLEKVMQSLQNFQQP